MFMNTLLSLNSKKFIFFSVPLFLIFACTTENLFGQYKFEYGFSLGTMKYEGDIGSGASIFNNKTSKSNPTASFHIGYIPAEFITLRASATLGTIQASDSLLVGTSPSIVAKKTRNQHFKSSILELALLAEIYPTVLFSNNPSEVKGKFRPYLLLGLGGFHFNPKGLYQSPNGTEQWIDLKPLRTEGQGMPNHPDIKEYSLNQINIPFGIGLKYFISYRFSIGFELINRKTKTDYLDDVSTRYIDNQDFYTFFGLTSPIAPIAAQMANKPAFKNGGTYSLGYGVGELRGSPKYNDYYYSSTIKVTYRFGANAGTESILQSKSGATGCPKNIF
jgi:hypothetical protein